MSDVNQVWFSGRLTRNPELRHTPSGGPVCDLTVASNRYTKAKADGKSQQYTTFCRVTVWNRQAEIMAERLHTGDEVSVVGQLVDDNFEQERDDGSMFKTSGRLKVDNARVNIVRLRSQESASDSEDELPTEIPEA